MSVTTGTFPGVRIADMPDLGSFTSGSSVVGELAGSGRFSAASLQAYIGAGTLTGTVTGTVTGAINQPLSGEFFVQDGATVARIADRLFVGPATANDGRYPNVSQDWLQAFLASPTGGSEVGPMVGTTMSVLSINGQFGFVSGSRTSDNTTPNSHNTIGIAAYAINDDTTSGSDAWAYYGEARRLSGVNDLITFGMEINVSNQGGVVAAQPYAQLPGSTIGHQIASGCGIPLPGAANTSAGIAFRANPTSFGVGIVFGANSIAGTNGVTGAGDAIIFAKGHTLTWYSSDGNQTSHIQGNISDSTLGMSLEFNNTGLTLQNATGGNLLVVPPVANSVNYLILAGAPAGGQVGVLANGSDADIDIKLVPRGAGYVDLNGAITSTATSGGATALPATPSSYISVKIDGAIRKIPCYNP